MVNTSTSHRIPAPEKPWRPFCHNTEEPWKLNTLRPRQNGRHFRDDMFNMNEYNAILIEISLTHIYVTRPLWVKGIPWTLKPMLSAQRKCIRIIHSLKLCIVACIISAYDLTALVAEASGTIVSFVLWFKFHWSLFLRVQLTLIQHWFR